MARVTVRVIGGGTREMENVSTVRDIKHGLGFDSFNDYYSAVIRGVAVSDATAVANGDTVVLARLFPETTIAARIAEISDPARLAELAKVCFSRIRARGEMAPAYEFLLAEIRKEIGWMKLEDLRKVLNEVIDAQLVQLDQTEDKTPVSWDDNEEGK